MKYDRCIQFSENFAPAYSRRGAAFLQMHKPEEAILDLQTAVQKCISNKHVHEYRLGQVLLVAGNVFGAIEAFSAAIEASESLIII